MKGTTTTTIHPTIRIVTHVLGLPVDICAGGIKLSIKANKEPQNPSPAIIHIVILPPSLKGRFTSLSLYRSTIAAAKSIIYIIKYSEDPVEYISAALSPATVKEVVLDSEKSCRVVVDADQLSLAIGKEGQNARLAARLTGMKIDIKSE